jgi:SAM-dependent methyltransferase
MPGSYYKTREGAEEQSSGTEEFILQAAELVRAVLDERFQPRSVLDVGCAGGDLVSVWRGHGVEASGVDISDYAVNHPKDAKIARHLHVVDVDCERLPFDDDSFDGATALEVLEHLRQPSFLLSELGRVIRDDGFVFITTPALPFETSLWRTLGIQSNPQHINVHSKRFWVQFFGRHGFGYCAELHSFIREAGTLVPADAPLQHWALRMVRTKLGRVGERADMALKRLVHSALLFQNHKDRTGESRAVPAYR